MLKYLSLKLSWNSSVKKGMQLSFFFHFYFTCLIEVIHTIPYGRIYKCWFSYLRKTNNVSISCWSICIPAVHLLKKKWSFSLRSFINWCFTLHWQHVIRRKWLGHFLNICAQDFQALRYICDRGTQLLYLFCWDAVTIASRSLMFLNRGIIWPEIISGLYYLNYLGLLFFYLNYLGLLLFYLNYLELLYKLSYIF